MKKLICVLFICLLAATGGAQRRATITETHRTPRPSTGWSSYQPSGLTDRPQELPPPGNQAAYVAGKQPGITPRPEDFRIVDGQLYNVQVSTNWHRIGQYFGSTPIGQFVISDKGRDALLGNWIVLDVYKLDLSYSLHFLKQVVLKNPPGLGGIAVGELFNPEHRVMSAGTVEGSDRQRLDVYDYGLPNTPENRELLANQPTSQSPGRELGSSQQSNQKAEAEARTLKYHQQLAEKGDGYGQLQMGRRYLKGDGVPKDLAKAKLYLSLSASQGNSDAAKEFAKLSVAETPPKTSSEPNTR